jgi:hypothetical protein
LPAFKGVAIGTIKSTYYEKSGMHYAFDFAVDKKIYSGNFCCMTSFRINLVNHKVVVLYQKNNPMNNFVLIRKTDMSRWMYINKDEAMFKDFYIE